MSASQAPGMLEPRVIAADKKLCPADQRIQDFLDAYLKDVGGAPRIPSATLVLEQAGLAREYSLPKDKDTFTSSMVKSYRVKQGILHNPVNDRRTTQGVFHVAEGGLPIPDDKLAVPKSVFRALLTAAFKPTDELQILPYTSTQKEPLKAFVSLLMRPILSPPAGVLGGLKTMEVRMIVPGSLIGNVDFVESIFGNGGDPYSPENDASLDVQGWTGHTGCIILAPHLISLKKKDVGLPSFEQATDRQKRDGMCWQTPDELYNNGGAFKITCRDERGVIVTIIADNYFGYCKKEVKTQISYAANLYGLAEEEHSGGAVIFPTYILGHDFNGIEFAPAKKRTIEEVATTLGDRVELKTEGYATDKQMPGIVYVPHNTFFNMRDGSVRWSHNGTDRRLKLLGDTTYVLPSGYRVKLEKQIAGPFWRLVGTQPEGTLIHKPCTVSGGGKSEISKSIGDAMIAGPVFTGDYHKDFKTVDEILKRDYSDCARDPLQRARYGRPILSPERSLGSVIKLFTPSPEHTDEYNKWLKGLPQMVRTLIFAVKRYAKPEWGDDWQEHFTVDRINGQMGHEVKLDGQKLIAHYLRVGRDNDGSWRVFKLRADYNPSEKVQMEDDITASVVLPREALSGLHAELKNPSLKLVMNCESKLFQRPDDAIYRGYDKQAEIDISSPNTFLTNWRPIDRSTTADIVEDIINFDLYTYPMKDLLRGFLKESKPTYVVSSAHPRLVDGKPSKNPRYLQNRPDQVNKKTTYLAEIGVRLSREIPATDPVYFPVNSVMAGRRNNPKDKKSPEAPPLAVYNPLHYQELPELFMDFVSSLTGKSPSTTGFGSEGALTKAPFNALWPVVDLNNALVSAIMTGYPGFTTPAWYIGKNVRIEHDLSLLIPELWARLRVEEREPAYLITNGYLEKVSDFEWKGKKVKASRLGYRITSRFAEKFLGRMFESPDIVFPEEVLKPETQDMEQFIEGVMAIEETQQRVAENYFKDGSVNAACPPLKALLHIMAKGNYEGKTVEHPDIRNLFSREVVIKSDWYNERLKTRQARAKKVLNRHIEALKSYKNAAVLKNGLSIPQQLEWAEKRLEFVLAPEYLKQLIGTIGADPFHLQTPKE